jgi:hypothetical protein
MLSVSDNDNNDNNDKVPTRAREDRCQGKNPLLTTIFSPIVVKSRRAA